MAYLPSDVLKRLAEEAAKGNDAAQNVLKKSGNEDMIKAPVQNTVQPVLGNPVQPLSPAQPVISWDVQTLTNPNYDPYTEQNNTQQTNPIDKVKQEEEAVFKMLEANKRTDSEKKTALRAKTIKDTATQFDINDELMRTGEKSSDLVDKQTAKFAVDAKYKVKTVDVSNIDFAQGNVELWCISDTQKGVRTSSDLNDQVYIGRDNLDGANKDDKYVLYNKDTHELYQYSKDAEQKDTLDRLQKAKDDLAEMQLGVQQSAADAARAKQSAYQALMDTVRDYHINLYGELSDDELAIVQPFIDMYSSYDSKLNSTIKNGDKRLEVLQNRVDALELYKEGHNTHSVNDYAVQKAIVNKYEDVQNALSGKMTTSAFKEKYNELPTIALLNKCAQDADSATKVLDSMNGSLYDDMGIADECNSKAADLLSYDEIARNAVLNASDDAALAFDMSNTKQVNSLVDIYRRYYTNIFLDKKGVIKSAINAIKDSQDYTKKVMDTITLSKEEDNINTGLSGVLLASMGDAGDLFTTLGSAALDARGLAGEYDTYDSRHALKDESAVMHVVNSFKDGKLLNAEYYTDRAATGTGLGTFIHNYGLVLEAYARGDLSAEFDINKVQSVVNGIDTTAQMEAHPLLSFITNLALSQAVDPTTYVGGIADDLIDSAVSDDLVKIYSDNIVNAFKDLHIDDSLIDTDTINKIIKNECTSALKEGRQTFDDNALMRIIDTYTTPLNPNFNEERRITYVGYLYDKSKKALEDIAGSSPEIYQLWEESAKIMKTGQTVKEIDAALNRFQLGYVGEILPTLKYVKTGLDILSDTAAVKTSTKAIANLANQFCYNVTKFIDKGSDGILQFDKLQNTFKASFNIDIIEDALKNGDTKVLDLDEFNKISDNLRVDYAKGVMSKELDTINRGITKRIDLKGLLSDSKSFSPESIQDMYTSTLKHKFITASDLDDMVITLTTGKHIKYSEYIDNLRNIAKVVDNPNSSTSRVITAVNAKVNRIESIISSYNDFVIRDNIRLMKACVQDGSDEALAILKSIDVSNIAPELQEAFSNIDVFTTKSNMDTLTKLIDKYTEAYGATVPKKQFRLFKNSLEVSDAVRSGKYVTPQQYVNHCLETAGVQPTDDMYSKIIKDTVAKYDDMELAGKLYEFIESSETNMNGILQNKSLRDLLDDDSILEILKREGLDGELRSIANLNAVDHFEYMLSHAVDAASYHAILDTVAGSHETINGYARRYKANPHFGYAVLDECADFIKGHVNNTMISTLDTGSFLDDRADMYRLKNALAILFNDMSDDCLTVIPTRDNVYSTLMSINEKVYNNLDPDVHAISAKIEKALEAGAYTTCNNELGSVLYSEALNKYITDIAGLPKEYHVNHMTNLADYIVKGDSVQLKTLIDLDIAKSVVQDDMVYKCLDKGKAITEELNDYCKSVKFVQDKLTSVPSFDKTELESFRTIINNMCKNLSEPAELRYLDYFNSIDFSDNKLAFSSIVDICARLGVDLDHVQSIATFSDVRIADIVQDYAAKVYKYTSTESSPNKSIIKLNNLVENKLRSIDRLEDEVIPSMYSKEHNSFKLRSSLYDALGITDGEGRAFLYKQQEVADELHNRYESINQAGGNKRRNVYRLAQKESTFWDRNVRRVINWDKETLDKALLCTHSNAIVCDTARFPELAKWLIEREADGYVVTRTQLGGTTVQILSMDFNACAPEYKEYLKNLAHSTETAMLIPDNDAFAKAVNSAFDGCANKFKNTNFSTSANGGKVNMDFHNQLQQLIPEQCRLDGDFTKMHNNAFVGNMLVDHKLSNAVGATRGHILGNCYYAECAALNDADSLGTIEDIVKVNNNSVEYWMNKYQSDTFGTENGFRYLYDDIKNSNYHIISMDSSYVADVGKKYAVHDVTDMYDYKHYALPTRKGMQAYNPTTEYLNVLSNKNHYIVDDLTYKYITGSINSNNRMMQYYTTPKLLHQAMDVVDSYRSAIVTGLLYASNIKGTGFRNIVDSNTKALAEVGLGDSAQYMHNWYNALDAKQSYVEQMAKIYDETGMQGAMGINKYIENHIDDLDFDAKELMLNHTIFTMNEMDDEVASKCAEIYNNKLLDSCTFAIDKSSRENIIKAFNKTRDAHWLDKNYRTAAEYEEFLQNELKHILVKNNSVNADEQISELTKLYGKWKNGSTEHWYTKMFDSNNIVGKNLSAINKNTFDNAETRCRYALMRTLMDNGMSRTEALSKVIKTQFDYGTQRGLSGGWDKLMPFAKYQFANAAYWLDCTNYSSFTLSNMRRLAKATYPLQSNTDAVKTAIAVEYYRRKYGEQETGTAGYAQKDPAAFFKDTIESTIDTYKGVKAAQAEGISVDDHHYIKIGNGFIDTISWLGKVFCAPDEIAKGEIPTILKDTVFGPLKVLPQAAPKFFKYLSEKFLVYTRKPNDVQAYDELYRYLKGGTDENGNYVYGQMSNVIGCIPVFGQLFNMCCTVAKNVIANKTLLSLALCSEGCTDSLLQSMCVQAESLGYGILNSIIGTRKDDSKFGQKIFTPYTDENGVRHTWSMLTDEEKEGYTFLPGISNDVQWAITPSARYGLYGRLAQAGLSKEDIKILTNRWLVRNKEFKVDDDGNVYTNTTALETVILDMLENGYTVSEISYLITATDKWYDVRKHQIIKSNNEMQQYFMEQAVLAEYNLIPDYIKYQPDMYSELMAQYKALGYNTREAWMLMRMDNTYLDEYGCMRTLSSDGAAAYTKWLRDEYYDGQEDDGFLEWYSQLPDYIQYEKGAYSRTLAYLKQMFSDEEAKQMIVNGAYYTADGRLINCKDLHRAAGYTNTAFQDAQGYWHKEGDFQVNGYWFHKGDNPYLGYKDFNDYYKHLPAYTQYTKGCFKTTNTVLKSAGFDYNTRMQAMLDGAVAMEIDPNSEAFKGYLAKQQIVAVTKTVYVDKQVPLRECSLVDGKWQWNGPQVVKVTDLGNGYTTEQITKEMEFNAAGMGLTTKPEWKSYDSAMVTVQVAQTVVTAEQDPNQIMYRIVQHDGKTYIIVPAPEYNPPRRNYYKKGSPKEWTKRRKPNSSYEKVKRVKGKLSGYNNQPMHIKYSNVRTYSKQHFVQQQGVGYEYWTQWGDARMTNHRNRNGRMNFPSTYRNPRSRQRNMYRDLYGKFGASRMNQRQNIAGYSNASITRLRRNDVANRSYNIKVNSARV